MKARKNSWKYSFLFICTLLPIIWSCSTIKPQSPDILVAELEIPKQEISSIKIPIKINLAPYFKETEKSVPKKFVGGEQLCEGVSYDYKFYRKPIKFEGNGTKLLFDVEGKYSLKLNYCLKCSDLLGQGPSCLVPRIYASCGVGEPMRKMHVSYETKIGVSDYYKLKSHTKFRSVKALTPCQITVFHYDATETLEEEVTTALKAVEKDIDKEITSVDLRPEMLATWKLLQEPTDLEGYGFLYLRPSNVSMSQIKFKGDTAYFNAILEARPTIYTSEISLPKKALPKLSKYKNRKGFDITMDIFATYDSLSSILTQNIKGTKVELSGREIIFGDIEVYGAYNSAVHLKVNFDGNKKGTLYLTGTPVFDSEHQHISFPDLNFDVKTKSALLKSAKWLFNKKITDAIRESASMDLKPYLDTLKTTLNESLNVELDEGVFMSGSIKDIEINLIHPKSNQLHIRVHSLGKLEMTM